MLHTHRQTNPLTLAFIITVKNTLYNQYFYDYEFNVQVSASYNLCSTAGFILKSKAVRVELSERKPLSLINIELDTRDNKCDDSGPR